MDSSLPCSSVPWVSQTEILEGAAIFFSKNLMQGLILLSGSSALSKLYYWYREIPWIDEVIKGTFYLPLGKMFNACVFRGGGGGGGVHIKCSTLGGNICCLLVEFYIYMESSIDLSRKSV